MASQQQEPDNQKTIWEEQNTGMFLQVLIDEINMGNRPGGHFTRPTWVRIAKEFANISGENYTVTQLKNKYDNMKKEFGMWDKLLREETGLGFDHETGRITADPIWWKNKIKEKPEYKRFRVSGPMHLDLQEQVFRGMVATGYMEYVPAKYRTDTTPNIPERSQRHTPSTDKTCTPTPGCDLSDATTTAPIEALPLDTPDPKSKGTRKRKRTTTASPKPTIGEVNENLMDWINIMKNKEVSGNNYGAAGGSKMIDYPSALRMLRYLPWLKSTDPLFGRAMALLEDPMKRQALAFIMEDEEECVRNYLGLWNN